MRYKLRDIVKYQGELYNIGAIIPNREKIWYSLFLGDTYVKWVRESELEEV